MIWLICYDIRDDKRLKRTAKYLEKCGLRVQKSFFQVEMDEKQFKTMKESLLSIIDRENDRLAFYPLCQKCSSKHEIIGKGEMMNLKPYEIL